MTGTFDDRETETFVVFFAGVDTTTGGEREAGAKSGGFGFCFGGVSIIIDEVFGPGTGCAWEMSILRVETGVDGAISVERGTGRLGIRKGFLPFGTGDWSTAEEKGGGGGGGGRRVGVSWIAPMSPWFMSEPGILDGDGAGNDFGRRDELGTTWMSLPLSGDESV